VRGNSPRLAARATPLVDSVAKLGAGGIVGVASSVPARSAQGPLLRLAFTLCQLTHESRHPWLMHRAHGLSSSHLTLDRRQAEHASVILLRLRPTLPSAPSSPAQTLVASVRGHSSRLAAPEQATTLVDSIAEVGAGDILGVANIPPSANPCGRPTSD
jgi:hypothetical protein